MLYVFHVDTGTTITLDMSLTTASVLNLKKYLEKCYAIPANMQVFLISGGQCLDDNERVGSYSAGTDTNPIYLFSKVETEKSQAVTLDFEEHKALIDKEMKYATLPASFQTVNKRAHLAQQFSESAIDMSKLCIRLISDQHNQQQGWAAVMANFEDVCTGFNTHYVYLENEFKKYLEDKEYFKQFLQTFSENIEVLRKIPILSKLINPNKKVEFLMETLDATSEKDENHITLYDYIGTDSHQNDVVMIYEKCLMEIELYTIEDFNNLASEVNIVSMNSEKGRCNEIQGMATRLFTLDILQEDVKKKVQEQNDLATSVTKNQARVNNLKDSSILPDLCLTHAKQLAVMSQNHKWLLEACDKCCKAKTELNKSLTKRLNWIVMTENLMQKLGDKIDIFIETIENLRYRISVLESISIAPVTYFSFIGEIIRRRSFSQGFLMWASEVACRLLTIHNEEVARRKEFENKHKDHFIKSLFPGMSDVPPAYGIQAPSYFDTGLPQLTIEDVEFMKNELPEMAEYLKVMENVEAPYSQLFKSILNIDNDTLVEDQICDGEIEIPEIKEDVGVISTHGLPHLRDIDKGCESETDTEEFEKVGQSPLDLNFDKDISSPNPITQDASTSTEGNLEISKSEYDKLLTLLIKIGRLAFQTINELKSELSALKLKYSTSQGEILENMRKLSNSCELLSNKHENNEKLLVTRMSNDHSNEINDFRKLAQAKNEEIKKLRSSNLFLENKVKSMKEELSTFNEISKQESSKLEERIGSLLQENSNCSKEIEKLKREHRDEIKTLQARFKLMRSDSGLEKSMECSSITNQESMINQMMENFNLEKEKAVNEAVKIECEKWKKITDEMKTDKDVTYDKNETLTKAIDSCNYVLSLIDDLGFENKLENIEDKKSDITTAIEYLQAIKYETELPRLTEKSDSATSPMKQKKSLVKMTSSSVEKPIKMPLDNIKHGDQVVVVWDDVHDSFIVVQNSPVMYFLHSECHELLNLEVTSGNPKKPNKLYTLGQYVDREYCHARKSTNRYKVPRGTRFFRVKVKPLEKKQNVQKPCTTMTQSQTIPQEKSTNLSEFHSLPPSPRLHMSPPVPEENIGDADEKIDSDNNEFFSFDDNLSQSESVVRTECVD